MPQFPFLTPLFFPARSFWGQENEKMGLLAWFLVFACICMHLLYLVASCLYLLVCVFVCIYVCVFVCICMYSMCVWVCMYASLVTLCYALCVMCYVLCGNENECMCVCVCSLYVLYECFHVHSSHCISAEGTHSFMLNFNQKLTTVCLLINQWIHDSSLSVYQEGRYRY